MLIDNTLFGTTDRVADSIARIRLHEPPDGYYFADSGGKDSTVVRHLLIKSGVKFDAHYSLTTVDPPELIRFIREFHPETVIQHPGVTMWDLIVKKRMPPTRLKRFCCKYLKEQGGKDRTVVTGIRWQESAKRRARSMVEGQKGCIKNGVFLHPIIDWTSDEVWEYIRRENVPYCALYDEGFKRLGCIGCPMSGKIGMTREFDRWPKYKAQYLRTFKRMLDNRLKDDLLTEWTSPEDVMDWWINGSDKKSIGQGTLFE